jgi:hypothetical protein
MESNFNLDFDDDEVSIFFRTHTYCGARTRAGTPCKRKDIWFPSGRCKLHGGMSTGPKTFEGKQRSAQNGFKKQIS